MPFRRLAVLSARTSLVVAKGLSLVEGMESRCPRIPLELELGGPLAYFGSLSLQSGN